jgi:hypothetical protein
MKLLVLFDRFAKSVMALRKGFRDFIQTGEQRLCNCEHPDEICTGRTRSALLARVEDVVLRLHWRMARESAV